MKSDFDFDLDDSEIIEELENMQLPSPTLLDYYHNRKERCIYWNSDISDDFVDLYYQILRWNKEDKGKSVSKRKPIKIYINSDGGSVNAVLAIIDMILLSKTPIYTIGLGKCYSSGGLLLMAGHKRFILPHTSILIHDGSSFNIGDTAKVQDDLEFNKEIEKKIKEFIISKTNITSKEYDKNYRKNWWILADEAVNKGIVDVIVDDIDMIL